MWEINNSLQLLSFARSLGLGVILGLSYDILRSLRKVVNYSAVAIFFQDIIFSVLAAFITFTFLLSVTNGEMRGFVLLGMTVGFFIARFTISVLWFRLLKFVFSRLKLVLSLISKWFYSGFNYLEKNINKLLQKSSKTIKKLLKKKGSLLYTKEDIKV